MSLLRPLAATAALVLALAGTQPAGAAVRYVFTAHSSFENISGALSYTAPNFITDNRFVSVAQMDACVVTTPAAASCTAASPFFANTSGVSSSGNDDYDLIGFQTSVGQPAYYFANGAFGAVGTYQTVEFGADQAATLVVKSVAGVPEPAAWMTLLLGFGALGGVLRSRQTRFRSTVDPSFGFSLGDHAGAEIGD